MENTTTPNTPAELVAQNKAPLAPETIWEEWLKMDPQDQEKFLWNGVRLMAEFHQFVVKKKLEDESSLKESGQWVGDGVKWEMMLQLMNTMM